MQSVLKACGDACANLDLRQPVTVSRDSRTDVASVLQALLRAIEKPEKNLAIPLTSSLRVQSAENPQTERGLVNLWTFPGAHRGPSRVEGRLPQTGTVVEVWQDGSPKSDRF